MVRRLGSYGTGLSTARSGLPAARQARSPDCSISMSADGGKVLVTGFLNSKERTDQFVFDILQAQGKWEKIIAFADSVSFAKKRLVSRKSRYSGLLDVLEFEEGDKYDAAVMEEKLQGISAWLCFDCEANKIKDSVEFAKKAGVKSMVISSSISAADVSSAGVEEALKVGRVLMSSHKPKHLPVSIFSLLWHLPCSEASQDEKRCTVGRT